MKEPILKLIPLMFRNELIMFFEAIKEVLTILLSFLKGQDRYQLLN